MSRSGYSEIDDQWATIRWRGQVASVKRGQKGQAFFRELLAALDALPEKRLISGELVITEHLLEPNGLKWEGGDPAYGYFGKRREDGRYVDEYAVPDYRFREWGDELIAADGTACRRGDVCALGALGLVRGIGDMHELDPEEPEAVAHAFGAHDILIREVVDCNDDSGPIGETPEARFVRVRRWVKSHIRPKPWEIWQQAGYDFKTRETYEDRQLGVIIADNFRDACLALAEIDADFKANFDRKRLTYKGRRLVSSEKHARRSGW